MDSISPCCSTAPMPLRLHLQPVPHFPMVCLLVPPSAPRPLVESREQAAGALLHEEELNGGKRSEEDKRDFQTNAGRDLLTFRGCAVDKSLCSLDNRMERFKSSRWITVFQFTKGTQVFHTGASGQCGSSIQVLKREADWCSQGGK